MTEAQAMLSAFIANLLDAVMNLMALVVEGLARAFTCAEKAR